MTCNVNKISTADVLRQRPNLAASVKASRGYRLPKGLRDAIKRAKAEITGEQAEAAFNAQRQASASTRKQLTEQARPNSESFEISLSLMRDHGLSDGAIKERVKKAQKANPEISRLEALRNIKNQLDKEKRAARLQEDALPWWQRRRY